MLPASAFTAPATMDKRVVFPHPLLPTMPTHSPGDAKKEISFNTQWDLYDLNKDLSISQYEQQLQILVELLYEYLSKGEIREIRQITDRNFSKKMNNCFAGEKNVTFAPDGKFYTCPAF